MLAINLLPLMVGAAVLPMWIIATLLLLRSEGGVTKAAAFAAGAMTVRVLQGILFGFVFDVAASAAGDGGSRLITSTLLLVVGILLSITTARTWRREGDPDAPPPKWMATLGGLSPPKAFGIGALLIARLTPVNPASVTELSSWPRIRFRKFLVRSVHTETRNEIGGNLCDACAGQRLSTGFACAMKCQ